jgi:hypothetical protein
MCKLLVSEIEPLPKKAVTKSVLDGHGSNNLTQKLELC